MKPILRPEDMSPALAAAFNQRDLDAMAAHYDEGAMLIDGMGTVHRGVEAIKAALKEMMEAGGVMTSTPCFVVVAGEIALSGASWRLEAGDAGERLEGRSLEVLNRQPDGSWRYLIDCPAADVLIADEGLSK